MHVELVPEWRRRVGARHRAGDRARSGGAASSCTRHRTPLGSVLRLFSAIVSEDRAQEISSSWGGCEAATGRQRRSSAARTRCSRRRRPRASRSSPRAATAVPRRARSWGQGTSPVSVEDPSGQPFATGVGGTSADVERPAPDRGGVERRPQPGVRLHQQRRSAAAPAAASRTNGRCRATSRGRRRRSVSSAELVVVAVHEWRGWPVDCREVPDVSADADPVTGYMVFVADQGGGSRVGGTSASAPLWAAYTALVNASAACRGQRVGFANPALYQVAATNYAANFNDITAASLYTGFAHNDTFVGTTHDGGDSNPSVPDYRASTTWRPVSARRSGARWPRRCARSARRCSP